MNGLAGSNGVCLSSFHMVVTLVFIVYATICRNISASSSSILNNDCHMPHDSVSVLLLLGESCDVKCLGCVCPYKIPVATHSC